MNSQLFTEQNDSDLNKTQYYLGVLSTGLSTQQKSKQRRFFLENLKFTKTSTNLKRSLIVSLHIFNEKTIPYIFTIFLTDQNLLMKKQTKR